MANGKSTWKYNKLLTARKNYFYDGSFIDTIRRNPLRPFTQDLDFYIKTQKYGHPTMQYLMEDAVLQNSILDGKYDKPVQTPTGWQSGDILSNKPLVGEVYGLLNSSAPQAIDFTSNAYHDYRGDVAKTLDFINTANKNGANIDINNLPGSLGGDPMSDEIKKAQGNTETKKSTNWAGIAQAAVGGASLVGNMINNIKSSDIDQNLQVKKATAANNQMGAIGTANDSFDQIMADASTYNPLNNVTKSDMGALSGGAIAGGAVSSAASGAAAGASFGPWGAAIGAGVGALTSIFGSAARNKKAKKAAAEANEAIDYSNKFNERSFANRAGNVMSNQMSMLEANYAALGGDLHTKGGIFSTGLTEINTGGSHESNPYEGVLMGFDPQGVPNLVEEGETIFNDYVYSKRLSVPNSTRKKYKLGGRMSFADASKYLAREAEERPNDPISQRGLKAIMEDLANTQEEVKFKKIIKEMKASGMSDDEIAYALAAQQEGGAEPTMEQPMGMEGMMPNMSAFGGKVNKFAVKGKMKRGNQTLNSKNNTPGLYFGLDPSVFNPYDSNGYINWGTMYGENSPYYKRRKYVLDNWDSEGVQKWLEKYVEGINKYNEGRKGYVNMTKDDITKDIFEKRTFDKQWGGMHAGIDYAGNPEPKIREEHKLKGKDGSLTDLPEADRYYPNTNFETGDTWDNTVGKRIQRLNDGKYEEKYDPVKNIITRRYFYSPIEEAKKRQQRHFYADPKTGKYVELTGEDNPTLWMKNNGYFSTSTQTSDDYEDFYYDPREEFKPNKADDWLRKAPAFGYGLGVLTDAFGLTNTPDYSAADAILQATNSGATYQPVGFDPIDGYLPYTPFDRDYYLNKQSAEAAATRRGILNTSGMNRGIAQAGILAADNNYLNGIGTLARQAEEFNFNNRKDVAEFRRGTKQMNSQGKLQAAMANQQALAGMRDYNLRGISAYAELAAKERQAADAGRSANLSGLFQTLGDIGYENANRNMLSWAIDHEAYGPGTGDYYWANGRRSNNRNNRNNTNTAAKGGKIKRKRGLTS